MAISALGEIPTRHQFPDYIFNLLSSFIIQNDGQYWGHDVNGGVVILAAIRMTTSYVTLNDTQITLNDYDNILHSLTIIFLLSYFLIKSLYLPGPLFIV